jgi:hypothetical protein
MFIKNDFFALLISFIFLFIGEILSQPWYDEPLCPSRPCQGVEWRFTYDGEIPDFEIPGTNGKCWLHLRVWIKDGQCPDGTRIRELHISDIYIIGHYGDCWDLSIDVVMEWALKQLLLTPYLVWDYVDPYSLYTIRIVYPKCFYKILYGKALIRYRACDYPEIKCCAYDYELIKMGNQYMVNNVSFYIDEGDCVPTELADCFNVCNSYLLPGTFYPIVSDVEYDREKNKGITLRIMPVPVYEYLTFLSEQEITEIEIFNQLGSMTKHYESIRGENNIKLLVSELNPGIYYYKVKFSNGETKYGTFPFIK